MIFDVKPFQLKMVKMRKRKKINSTIYEKSSLRGLRGHKMSLSKTG